MDDEPAIRQSLPAILEMHGFTVVSVGTVGEALQAIGSGPFDVLISDLNIGSPGDGFTVVSAMRRTQPDCVTLILTGFPAFESALEAIRSQVDDYLIKPAGVETLVSAIEERLRDRRPHCLVPLKRVSEILRENVYRIARNFVLSDRYILQLAHIHLTDEECQESAKRLVLGIADQLAAGTSELSPEMAEMGLQHGRARHEQGYTASELVEENRLLSLAILDCIQENLLIADVSNLIPDLKTTTNVLVAILREAMTSYNSERQRAA